MSSMKSRDVFAEILYMLIYAAIGGAAAFFCLSIIVLSFISMMKLEGCYLSNVINISEFMKCHFSTFIDQKALIFSSVVVGSVVFGLIGLSATAYNLWRVSRWEKDKVKAKENGDE